MSTTQTVQLYDDIRNAIDTKGALCVMYLTGGKPENAKARVIVPRWIATTKTGADFIFAWDSIRKTEITMRVDFIASAHKIG